MSINDLKTYSRNWNLEFIERYRQEKCLWKSSHPDYSNQSIRIAAYDNLVEKLREVEPNPDRNMVVRKINSLRSAFRREYRKKCNNPEYEVRLWYFDKLLFIATEKATPHFIYPNKRRLLKVDEDSGDFLMLDQKPNIKSSDSNTEQEIEEILHEEEEEEEDHVVEPIEVEVDQKNKLNNAQTFKILDISALQASNSSDIQNALDNQSTNHTNVQSIPTISITKEQFPQLFSPTFQHQQNQSTTSQGQSSSPSNNSQKMNDEYDAIGLNVAVKLRSMNSHQRIIAEKLIGDVLFNGQLNTLSITSHLTQ
ncbi:hypothetical protein ACFFRR_005795 [Megaselia abdita]